MFFNFLPLKACANGKCLSIKHCLVTKRFTVWIPFLITFNRSEYKFERGE